MRSRKGQSLLEFAANTAMSTILIATVICAFTTLRPMYLIVLRSMAAGMANMDSATVVTHGS